MTTPYLVTKPHKSAGIAILLTFLFGPIGLFYASVSGGLIMTFSPILLFLLLIVGFFQNNSMLMGWSFGLLIIFAGTFWLINIIWAILSVRSYNRRIEDDARRQFNIWNEIHRKDPNQFIINIDQTPIAIDANLYRKETIEIASKPNLQEWLKNNPGKTINDYFSKYGR